MLTALEAARQLVAALEAHASDPNEATHNAVLEVGEQIEHYIFSGGPWH